MIHFHKCRDCGFLWAHSEENLGNVSAHTCKNCKKEEWQKYPEHLGQKEQASLMYEALIKKGQASQEAKSEEAKRMELENTIEIFIGPMW